MKKKILFWKWKTEILRQIEQTGSISEAAKNLNMNYKNLESYKNP